MSTTPDASSESETETDAKSSSGDELTSLLSEASPTADLGARQSFSALTERLFGERPTEPRVGPYLLENKLAAGGGGVVYTARDPERERTVAVKLLLPKEEFRTANARARLLREGRSLAKLSHENIVEVFDLGTYDPSTLWLDGAAAGDKRDGLGVYIVMEYVEGHNLARWIEAERPGWERVRDVFLAAGRGLAAAHAAGLIHRDFKPANVLVGDDGRVRVADFGLARATRPVATGPVSHLGRRVNESAKGLGAAPLDLSLTATGAFVGTPAYMPPEQQTGAAVGPQSDQYSFCVALWEGWFGTPPFDGATASEILKAKLEGRFLEPPKDHEVPPHLIETLHRGMSPHPEDRLESMDALLAALTQGPSSDRGRWYAVAAAIAGVGALGLFAIGGHVDDACQGLRVAMKATWSADTTSTLASRPPLDGSINTSLDRWVGEWTAANETVCTNRATAPLDPPVDVWCLEESRRLLDQLVRAQSEIGSLGWSRAATALPDPAVCPAQTQFGDDPAQPLRSLAIELDARRLSGRLEDATPLADSLAQRAAQRGSSRARARAYLSLARFHAAVGDPTAAADALDAAQAQSTDDDIRAQIDLARLEFADPDGAPPADVATLLARTYPGWPTAAIPEFEARRKLAAARRLLATAQPSQAQTHLRGADRLLRGQSPPHPLMLELLVLRAESLRTFELDGAVEKTTAEAIAVAQELYGKGHPMVEVTRERIATDRSR